MEGVKWGPYQANCQHLLFPLLSLTAWHWALMAHRSTIWSFPCLAPSLLWNFNDPRRNYITIRNYDTLRLLTPLSAYITANTEIIIRYWNFKNEFEALAAVLCSVPCQTLVPARFLYLHRSPVWAEHCNQSLRCIQCNWLNIQRCYFTGKTNSHRFR